MKENINSNRRNALKMSLTASGALFALAPIANAIASSCAGKTPAQPEGPFYPIHAQLDGDNDLTYVHTSEPFEIVTRADGQVVYIQGAVLDEQCNPVEGVLVEIWQACKTGKYNHPSDPNTAKLDPNFQYWGKCITDKDGKYTFKTILPGAYPAGNDWVRPPHIHYKISKLGYMELITQMYFLGDSLNDKDLILKRLKLEDQKKVVVELKEPTEQFEPDSKICEFNITIEKV